MRDSDDVIVDAVERLLARSARPINQARVLDVGCSTGALLYHLRRNFAVMDLHGMDISAEAIKTARNDPRLEGVTLHRMDVGKEYRAPIQPFDVVIASAVLQAWGNVAFDRGLGRIAALTRPGGSVVLFDWFLPFVQSLRIIETSQDHPNGYGLNMRSYAEIETALRHHGFLDVVFLPFEMRGDLPGPGGTHETLGSYTVKREDGERMCFRGGLYQPWCHVTARKTMKVGL